MIHQCAQGYTYRGWGGLEQRGRIDSILRSCPNLQSSPEQIQGYLQSLPRPVGSACQLSKENIRDVHKKDKTGQQSNIKQEQDLTLHH